MRAVLASLSLVGLFACSIPVRQARLDSLAAPTQAEIDAADRARARSCGPTVGYLWPGIGQACVGRSEEGMALAALAAAEAGAGVALLQAHPPAGVESAFEQTGPMVPLILLQDTYVYSLSRSAVDQQMARWLPYTPQDELTELIAAPFNVQVLRRPGVWAGALGLTGAAIAVDLAMGSIEAAPGGDPNVFGWTAPAPVGYPLLGAAGVTTFSHVAIAEEISFRGLIQSGLVLVRQFRKRRPQVVSGHAKTALAGVTRREARALPRPPVIRPAPRRATGGCTILRSAPGHSLLPPSGTGRRWHPSESRCSGAARPAPQA